MRTPEAPRGSYLKNAEAIGSDLATADGVLLYPVTGEKIDALYHIQGHDVRIATTNLDQPWQGIEADLRALISSQTQAVGA